ncbi:putative nuclease HARBI1 [Monomorium pharaonis]|uniref:putative nuclease HARBI1 n=1 Tax=Monomorium pharaonis TaxID=307658 RepID=UPI00063F1135|nr:putative nuclease HARBI1 [Monomorium pharaonis]
MDNLIIAMFAQEDRDNTMLRIRRRLRDASDLFNVPGSEFCSLYRLPKEVVIMLIENLGPLLPNARRRHAVPVELQVSDYEGKILATNVAHGGRTHDARVWRASILSNHMQEMYVAGRKDAWLLGDSAYPLLPYLMTPKLNEPEGSPSARYTQCHIRARFCVERCIGVLKGRWRCLRKERSLHYAPEVAARIVNAACVLHNVAVKYRVPEPDLYYDEIDQEFPEVIHDAVENGHEVRERIINTYFQNG